MRPHAPSGAAAQHNGVMSDPLRVMVTAGAGGIGAVIAETFAAAEHACTPVTSRVRLSTRLQLAAPSIVGTQVDLSDERRDRRVV